MTSFLTRTFLIMVGVVLSISLPGMAQFMQDNAPDGNSSIIGGTTVSFDVQKTTLQLDYTGKFGKPGISANAQYWNWGASLSGGNSNRLAQLLQNGTFTPSARISGFVFHGWDVGRKKLNDVQTDFNSASADVVNFRDANQKVWFDVNLKPTLFAEIQQLANSAPTSHTALETIYTKNILLGIALVLNRYQRAQATADPALKSQFDAILALIADKMDTFNKQPIMQDLLEREELMRQRYFTFQSLNPVRRFLVYGRVGTSATGFSYLPSINPANIAGSFKDSLFTSPYAEIGGNFYTRGYLIMGLNAGYGRVNTLQNTDPVSYDYQVVTNGPNGQQLTTKRELKAYEGTPTQYDQLRVKADLIALLPTGNRGTLALNPYVRFLTGGSATNSWRYGLAGYYFNRKGGFMGGIYAERTLLVTEISRNTFSLSTNRISVGIRASYLLDTVFNAGNAK